MSGPVGERVELCRGSNGGLAIYIGNDDGGFRAWGPKCWGSIKPVVSFPLTVGNIDEAIQELQAARKRLAERKAGEADA